MKIRTIYDPKPIPDRSYDWTATWDSYEPGQYVGTGRTEQQAVRDLLDNAPTEESIRSDSIIEYGQRQ